LDAEPNDILPVFPKALGVELTECSPDLVVGTLTARPEHANRNGVMHGGAILGFADTLGGVASSLNLSGDDKTTTLESKTNFLRPVAIGTKLTGRCEAIHNGRKTQVWQITLIREDGKAAAVTTQTQMTLTWQPPA